MASTHDDPRYNSKIACITDHTGKQAQLRTGITDPNEAAIAANVLELLAKREPAVAADMLLYSDVADLLTRLLLRLRPRDYAHLSTLELLEVFSKEKGGVKGSIRARNASIGMFKRYFKDNAKRPPHRFTEFEMLAWKKHSIDGGYDPETFMERFRFIKELFGEMIRHGIVTRNPCDNIKLTSTERRVVPIWETDPFEDEEYAAMYRAAAKRNDYQLCGVLMAAENAGCRPVEIAHLLWRHIFLNENCMRYITSKANVPSEQFFTDQFREYLISLGDDHAPDDAVFPSYINASGEQKLSMALVELMEEAGIDRQPFERELEDGVEDIRKKKRTKYKKRPYSTRHTISGRISDKFGLDVSKKVLNQRDMRSTMRYAKPQRSTMKNVAKHLSTKVVGSVGMFKQEREKHEALEKAKMLRAERREREAEEGASRAMADPVFRNSLQTFLATVIDEIRGGEVMPKFVKHTKSKKLETMVPLPVPDE